MADERRPLDDLIHDADQRITRLERHVPPAEPPARSEPAPRAPLSTVRFVLGLFIFVAGMFLLQDVIDIFLQPDGFVFIVREGGEFHAWRDVRAFEAATGKDWMKLPPGSFNLNATYHGAKRDRASEAILAHALFLLLSVSAYRKLRQAAAAGGADADPRRP